MGDSNLLIQSPLNYTGGKYKLLPQILPHFPKQIGTFVDLFCGGCNVGINIQAGRVIFNDDSPHLLHLYKTFKVLGKDKVLKIINEIIDKYGLSRSNENGYAYYDCESSSGLVNYNRERFLRLRSDFNDEIEDYNYHIIMLFVLIVYAFNNQIRFNSKGEFNLPVGKRDFNDKMKDKLCTFIDKLNEGNHRFVCEDFRKFDVEGLTENSLVYCDPPYLITCATYNEKDGWNEQCERDLYAMLDSLNRRQIRFALSNVLSSKGKVNTILAQWLERSNYRVIHLDYSYSNSNYQTKNKTGFADEVLVLNY